MKSLWFKQIYVQPILSGEKNYTVRKEGNRNPSVGEIVSLTVGPRPAFARAKIIDKTVFIISSEMKELYGKLYPDYIGTFEKIVFSILDK